MASLMDPSMYGGVYQGLESEDESSQQPTQEQKPKRKRENRYKNAPPSVLSVCDKPFCLSQLLLYARCKDKTNPMPMDSAEEPKTALLRELIVNARTRG